MNTRSEKDYGKKHKELLQILSEEGKEIPSLRAFCFKTKFDFDIASGFIKGGLLDHYITYEESTGRLLKPTPKAKQVQEIPGYSIVSRAVEGKAEMADLEVMIGKKSLGMGFSSLKKESLVQIVEEMGKKQIVVDPRALSIYEQRQSIFKTLLGGGRVEENETTKWFVDEGMSEVKLEKDYRITPKENLLNLQLKDSVSRLTSQLISSGAWKQAELKHYDINAPSPLIRIGHPSIVEDYIQMIREIFLDMGFDEMEGHMVTNSFWNFDVLFTAQDHPAREVHDTFYLENPSEVPLPNDEKLINAVKLEHERAYANKWDHGDARKALLRTHTTSSTAKKLLSLAGRDGKFFSIDRVFRNETVDSTHLAEFYQIEGVVLQRELTIADLSNYITEFYNKLGFDNIKFKPTYNPYTEPSLEIFGTFQGQGEDIELGNSGMFRPEMLRPLGQGEKHSIAWGLGLERLIMIRSGAQHLAEILGSKIKIGGSYR